MDAMLCRKNYIYQSIAFVDFMARLGISVGYECNLIIVPRN